MKRDHYERTMLYMTARILEILGKHYNVGADSADQCVIQEAYELAAGVVLGRANGGHARAAALTKERRVEIAKKAATTRWGRSVS